VTNPQAQQLKSLGLAVINTEIEAISALRDRIDDNFISACRYLLKCEGRIVVIGMGKSGHIGGKIAATLASTGSPAFFVHPGEASHGDLGMITDKDVVLALSNSGETSEILTILPLIKRLGVPLITMTGKKHSTLANSADAHLDVSVDKEACPLGLAPTSSTTVTLVMGDALAIALLEARGFTAEDFALSHPGGNLGRRLLLHVSDIMHTGIAIPQVNQDALISDALIEMTDKGLGMTAVLDEHDKIIGIFTDGDLRRVLAQTVNVHTTPLTDFMTQNCKTGKAEMLAAEALELMQRHKINFLGAIGDATLKPLLKELDSNDYDLSELKGIFASGMPTSAEVKEGLLKKHMLNTRFIDFIGGSELTGMAFKVYTSKDTEFNKSSFPITDRILIVNSKTGEPVSPGEVGELARQTDHLPNGYYNDPEKTRQHQRDIPVLLFAVR